MFSGCQVSGADGAVMTGGEVLRGVVSLVGGIGSPVVAELALVGTASEPVEAHVHGLKLFASNVEGDDAQRGCVVCLHWHQGLLVS